MLLESPVHHDMPFPLVCKSQSILRGEKGEVNTDTNKKSREKTKILERGKPPGEDLASQPSQTLSQSLIKFLKKGTFS